MKCGREIALGQAFCKDCLADMADYPVKSDTPIQIPSPPPSVHTTRRSSHTRRGKKPEEQLAKLRKLVRLQTIILIVLTLLIAAGCFWIIKTTDPDNQPLPPGENYSTSETTEAPTT